MEPPQNNAPSPLQIFLPGSVQSIIQTVFQDQSSETPQQKAQRLLNAEAAHLIFGNFDFIIVHRKHVAHWYDHIKKTLDLSQAGNLSSGTTPELYHLAHLESSYAWGWDSEGTPFITFAYVQSSTGRIEQDHEMSIVVQTFILQTRGNWVTREQTYCQGPEEPSCLRLLFDEAAELISDGFIKIKRPNSYYLVVLANITFIKKLAGIKRHGESIINR